MTRRHKNGEEEWPFFLSESIASQIPALSGGRARVLISSLRFTETPCTAGQTPHPAAWPSLGRLAACRFPFQKPHFG